MKLAATVKLNRIQYTMLRQRYGTSDVAELLIRAANEVLALEAQKELAEANAHLESLRQTKTNDER